MSLSQKILLFFILLIVGILSFFIYKIIKSWVRYINLRQYYKKKYFVDEYPNRLEISKEDYMVFKDSKIPLHKYIYESEYDKKMGKNIHHIDRNNYNNEIWNLIALDWKVHKESVKHGRIKFGDWNSGIEELRRIGLSDKEFPQEVIKRLRNQ